MDAIIQAQFPESRAIYEIADSPLSAELYENYLANVDPQIASAIIFAVIGFSLVTGVEFVDQNPIGKSSRSNPVTYLKVYDDIRHLFAQQPLSKQMGCFGFEHLYYAGLLGKATKHLVKAIQIDYPDEAKKDDYSVEFKYSTNKSDQIELCTFILNDEAVSVNYVY